MMQVEWTQLLSIVHTHVTQYLPNRDLVNFKIALPKDYDFYLSDSVVERILIRMLVKKGVLVCRSCVGLVDIPKSRTIELVQSYYKIIQEITFCCYNHDTFISEQMIQSPNIYFAKHSTHEHIFNYAETQSCMDDVYPISPSFADMIGKIENLENSCDDQLVFVYFSTDRKACIALPINIACEWCTNCDEGHYNTTISVCGHRNIYCTCCGISFCCCNSDYIICDSCETIWCYTCEENGAADGEVCCSNCGRFICGSCMEESDCDDHDPMDVLESNVYSHDLSSLSGDDECAAQVEI